MAEFTGTVSERDRDYFRRLAQFNAELDAKDREEWFAKSMDERAKIISHRARMMKVPYIEEDSAEELYRRARRLGLYLA